MKQVILKDGQAQLEDVPAPILEPGTVLVRTAYSCVSVGTEMTGLRTSAMPLWKRALNQPGNVKKVLDMASSQGLTRTWQAVQSRTQAGSVSGYSAAGIVLAVGEGIDDLQPGDRVACAGAQCANHAEFLRVPRNLCVNVPEGLDLRLASTVTLGAIALQGIRRANLTMGETVVIVGLGVLGQLCAQLARVNGCRVIGVDLDSERLRLARRLGMDVAIEPNDGAPADQVARLTDGIGADAAIITAASSSHEVISTTFRMCRKKGRVVLVGDVGLNLNRADFYAKEIDFFISTSYGPGRYDASYEEKGLDYPVPYVRWTENRNMAEYLRLLSEKRVDAAPLIASEFPLNEVGLAYRALDSDTARPLTAILRYPTEVRQPEHVVRNPAAPIAKPGRIRVAIVGAGGFAKSMHLPNLSTLPEMFHLRAVCSRTGHNAAAIARQFKMDYATTTVDEILADPEVDAVVIATRHHVHAAQALEALKRGKHVFVEKPLALTSDELESVLHFFDETPAPPVLLTGFNRRFSPYVTRLKELVQHRSSPLMLSYRMNAGYLPLDHWLQGPEGGGRNQGEACHIYDLFTYLVGHPVVEVQVSATRPGTAHYTHLDNFAVHLRFEDGSLGVLTYTALGHPAYPKEWLEAFFDGKVGIVENYQGLSVHGAKGSMKRARFPNKGHREELVAFGKAIQEGGAWPIPLWEQEQATRIALKVEELLRNHTGNYVWDRGGDVPSKQRVPSPGRVPNQDARHYVAPGTGWCQ